MGLTGRLAGPLKNRVKPIRLRGELSLGVIYPLEGSAIDTAAIEEGTDLAERLGITKWEPPVPVSMSGTMIPASGPTPSYDIENLRRWPNAFTPGESVWWTEKLHGSWCCLGLDAEGRPLVTSKGMSAKRLVFQIDAPDNETNIYVQAWRRHENQVRALAKTLLENDEPRSIWILGEIVGRKIQDLDYGLPRPAFRLFDIGTGPAGPDRGRWLNWREVQTHAAKHDFVTVPLLEHGPWDPKIVTKRATGTSAEPAAAHGREGIVVRPERERFHPELGRVILKAVNDAYLLRPKGTEHQ